MTIDMSGILWVWFTFESAGLRENLSLFSPCSSNNRTTRSDVHTASFWLLFEKAIAQILAAPSWNRHNKQRHSQNNYGGKRLKIRQIQTVLLMLGWAYLLRKKKKCSTSRSSRNNKSSMNSYRSIVSYPLFSAVKVPPSFLTWGGSKAFMCFSCIWKLSPFNQTNLFESITEHCGKAITFT